jgi:hypothetical protein
VAFTLFKELSDSSDFLHLMCARSTIERRQISDFDVNKRGRIPGGLGANSFNRAGGSKDVIQLQDRSVSIDRQAIPKAEIWGKNGI